MEQINQHEKTLVFCATQDHALAVRDLVNQMKASKDPNYCQRVTAANGALGDQYLREFQDNEKTIPTILTTSQKLSTGVDARNIRNIVLMRPINSMIEFKQIIGRGTRLFDGKDYFTIYDFVRAHHHFNDPEWDGEPIAPEPRAPRRPRTDPPEEPAGPEPEPTPPRQKLKVKLADGKARTIQHMMVTSLRHPDRTPMSAQQFLEMLFGRLPEFFRDEDELRALWSNPDTRAKLLHALAEKGFGPDQMSEMQRIAPAHHAGGAGHAGEDSDRRPFQCEAAGVPRFCTQPIRSGRRRRTGQGEAFPLLRLKYNDAIADAIADLGRPEEIGKVFSGFQKYLYQQASDNRPRAQG